MLSPGASHVVTLVRTYHPDAATGISFLPSGRCIRTIERPWLDNRPNVSCYPEGAYLCKWLERSASGRYKRVWHVQQVPGRTGILWHAGNLVRHSLGCTLPGMKTGTLEQSRAVLSSGAALNLMRQEMGGEDFVLVVTS